MNGIIFKLIKLIFPAVFPLYGAQGGGGRGGPVIVGGPQGRTTPMQPRMSTSPFAGAPQTGGPLPPAMPQTGGPLPPALPQMGGGLPPVMPPTGGPLPPSMPQMSSDPPMMVPPAAPPAGSLFNGFIKVPPAALKKQAPVNMNPGTIQGIRNISKQVLSKKGGRR